MLLHSIDEILVGGQKAKYFTIYDGDNRVSVYQRSLRDSVILVIPYVCSAIVGFNVQFWPNGLTNDQSMSSRGYYFKAITILVVTKH